MFLSGWNISQHSYCYRCLLDLNDAILSICSIYEKLRKDDKYFKPFLLKHTWTFGDKPYEKYTCNRCTLELYKKKLY